MATTKQLLHLSKEIANKARQLIPRSSNRVIFGDADRNDLAKDSKWRDAPEYVPGSDHGPEIEEISK
jgi:hypothetical protein